MQKSTRTLLVGAIIVLCLVGSAWCYRFELLEIVREGRAHDVPSTFLRMSPNLRNAIDTCDETRCAAESDRLARTRAIVRDWPRVYDYLKYPENWGNARLSRVNRDQFFAEVQGYTPGRLREDYLPVLDYRNGSLILRPCSRNDRRLVVPKEKILARLCE
jgi:hypothetical protein